MEQHPSCHQVNTNHISTGTASDSNYHCTQSINPSLEQSHSQIIIQEEVVVTQEVKILNKENPFRNFGDSSEFCGKCINTTRSFMSALCKKYYIVVLVLT